jgi:DNA-binding IclR family transcriptional regulator
MSTVQSIERAFAVLGALANGPGGVTDLAQRVALPKSTAARLLRSLAREQVVEQIPGETRWRLGPRIVTLAAAVRPTRSLVALARPYLSALSKATGEAAGLSVPDGFAVHYVDQVESPQPVGVRDWTGTRLPMHAVSSGHVFLAHLRPTDLESFLAGTLERITDNTTTDPERLRERLRSVLRDGFAWTIDEYAEGISSIAAPVAADDGEVVAAIHVHGPSYRFPARGASPDAASAVVDCARSIGARLRDDR